MIRATIVGGSGYTGGELIRLLHLHPEVEIFQITSERNKGKAISSVHPHFRGILSHKFVSIKQLEPCDLLFLCLPHGQSMQEIDKFREIAPNIIDLSADFRLENSYEEIYKKPHSRPDLLDQFVYGIPELHREEMRDANYISSAGCNATAIILALYPLIEHDLIDKTNIVADVKVGSSEAGARMTPENHYPMRSRSVRSYKPTGHRHVAEVRQELGDLNLHMSATSIDTVRGVLATIHTTVCKNVTEKELWKIYREYTREEPFLRLVKQRSGNFRYPDPKVLAGSNYCDIGFELDGDRLVVISALDNLMKGAAGQAVQAMNIMFGWDETLGLEFPGLLLY